MSAHGHDHQPKPVGPTPELSFKGAQGVVNDAAEVPVYALVLTLSIGVGLVLGVITGLLPGQPATGNTQDLTSFLERVSKMTPYELGQWMTTHPNMQGLWAYRVKMFFYRGIPPYGLGLLGLALGLTVRALMKEFDELKLWIVGVPGIFVGFILHVSLLSLRLDNIFGRDLMAHQRGGLYLLAGFFGSVCFAGMMKVFNRNQAITELLDESYKTARYLGEKPKPEGHANAQKMVNDLKAIPADIGFLMIVILLGIGASCLKPGLLELAQTQVARLGLDKYPAVNGVVDAILNGFARMVSDAQHAVVALGFLAVLFGIAAGGIVRLLRLRRWTLLSDLALTWPAGFIAGMSAHDGLVELAHEKLVHATDLTGAMLSGVLVITGFVAAYCFVTIGGFDVPFTGFTLNFAEAGRRSKQLKLMSKTGNAVKALKSAQSWLKPADAQELGRIMTELKTSEFPRVKAALRSLRQLESELRVQYPTAATEIKAAIANLTR